MRIGSIEIGIQATMISGSDLAQIYPNIWTPPLSKTFCSIDLFALFSETYVKMSLSREPVAMENLLIEDHSEVQSHVDCSGDAKPKVGPL